MPDCDGPHKSLYAVSKGNHLCYLCEGTGEHAEIEQGLVSLATFDYVKPDITCKECSGKGQCQSCGGTGYEYYSDTDEDEEDDKVDDKNEDETKLQPTFEEDSSSSYESDSSATYQPVSESNCSNESKKANKNRNYGLFLMAIKLTLLIWAVCFFAETKDLPATTLKGGLGPLFGFVVIIGSFIGFIYGVVKLFSKD